MITHLIVGLGNPGKAYENTWHNVGFMTLDSFAAKQNAPQFKLEKKFQSKLSQVDDLLLVKPQTFMNKSGDAVCALTDYYKIPTDHIFVIHDDIALPLGQIRVSFARGAGGHNGVASIIERLGTNEFVRFRIGIYTQADIDLEAYVLAKITDGSARELDTSILQVIDAVDTAIHSGVEAAMTQFNTTDKS